jgi:GNAT superfamily N-acetyltransferase
MNTERVVLRDGAAISVRPVRPTDGPVLVAGFARLGAESRRSRFLTPKRELTAAEVRFYTEVDHDNHEAIGAVAASDGSAVGIARYVRSAHEPQQAEIAVTVVDEWQRRGVGTVLLTRLAARALSVRIRTFRAVVGRDNTALIGLLRRTAGVELVEIGPDSLDYEISLARSAARLSAIA